MTLDRIIYTMLCVALGIVIGDTLADRTYADPPAAPPTITIVLDEATPLPTDPFTRCAVKALRGDYPLQEWQRVAYLHGLANGVGICGLAELTAYGDRWENEVPYDCEGRPLYVGVCAAPRSIPLNSIVWTNATGLMIVRDRGSAVTLARTGPRENMNLDQYTLTPVRTRRCVSWALVRRGGTWGE